MRLTSSNILVTTLLVCGLFYSSDPATAQETMTIKDAYIALEHNQTTFDLKTSKIPYEDAKYLDHMFFVTDLAFRERMVMLKHFNEDRPEEYFEIYNQEIDNIIDSFALLKTSNTGMIDLSNVVKRAILEQKKFFDVWYKNRGTPAYNSLKSNYASHSLVQSSHRKLIQVYNALKRTYGEKETPHNIQSFYDHLCALDFI